MMAGKSKPLKDWAKKRKTSTIAEALSAHPEIEDPDALAVYLRKKALGPAEFAAHQAKARRK
jgi:hypothetical protein